MAAPGKEVSKFNQLILVASREFHSVTSEMIYDMRKSHQLRVAHGIESFAKRSVIRNIADKAKLSKEQLSQLYDRYYSVQFYAQKAAEETKAKFDPTKMDYDTFRKFLSELTNFVKPIVTKSPALPPSFAPASGQTLITMPPKKEAGRDIIERLLKYFDKQRKGTVKFEDTAIALGEIQRGDMLSHIEWVFKLFDSNNDGQLDNSETILLSEALLYMLTKEDEECPDNDEVLRTMSTFMSRCFEFTENKPPPAPIADLMDAPNEMKEPGAPGLTLAAFRAVVLSDALLETFFDKGIRQAFLDRLAHSSANFTTTNTGASPSIASATAELNNQRKMLVSAFWKSTSRFVSRKGKSAVVELDKPGSASPGTRVAAPPEPIAESSASSSKQPSAGAVLVKTTIASEAQSDGRISNPVIAANVAPNPTAENDGEDDEDEEDDDKAADVLTEVDRLLNDLDIDFGEDGRNDLGSFEGSHFPRGVDGWGGRG